jgi:hypothetical protein
MPCLGEVLLALGGAVNHAADGVLADWPLEAFIEHGCGNTRRAVVQLNAHAETANANVDLLFVKTIMVDEGPQLRRFMPRAMGRATRINKKTSHVTCVLAERA